MSRVFTGKVILYLLVLLVCDLCLTPVVRTSALRPTLLPLLIPYAAFEWHPKRILPVAFLVGLLVDLTGAQPLGVATVAFVGAAWIFKIAVQKTERHWLLIQLVLTFSYLFVASAAALALSLWLGNFSAVSNAVVGTLAGSSLVSTAFFPLFVRGTRLWFRDAALLKQCELF